MSVLRAAPYRMKDPDDDAAFQALKDDVTMLAIAQSKGSAATKALFLSLAAANNIATTVSSFTTRQITQTNAGVSGYALLNADYDPGGYISSNRFHLPPNEIWLLGASGNGGAGGGAGDQDMTATIQSDSATLPVGLPALCHGTINPAPLNTTRYVFAITALVYSTSSGATIGVNISTTSILNYYENLVFWGCKIGALPR